MVSKQLSPSVLAFVVDGDIKNGSLMAGQVSGMIREIRPLRQIFEDMVREYEQIG